ncbi:FAD-dependent oxidoreductase [Microtetraspora malaysiensis]|uniref:FAD-dependent oxidoreductase n=1 Tax=Microtetraspora malaysiensis TaxID=161358 RepID=UPI003D902449
MHVLIIGGGIGGLCLAQGLKRAGVSATVYERDAAPDARLQGYRLNIEPVGSRSLHSCLPPELWDRLIAASGDPGPGMGVFDERLRELMQERSNAGRTSPVEAAHAVSRVALRAVLLDGVDVRFGKEFVRYEQLQGEVVAHFADGSTASGTLLVGADGSRSRVKRQLLPGAGQRDPAAFGVGGKLPLTPEAGTWLPEVLTTNKNMILPRRDFLFTAAFRPRAGEEGYLMWAFVAHRSTYAGQDPHGFVLERSRRWHPDLRRLVAESGGVELFDFRAAAKVKPWATTNVTLLGDAVHNMPPVGGLGGNTALRDAGTLRDALTSGMPLIEAVRDYEAEMLSYGFAAAGEALMYLRLATVRSRLVRGAARGFFRLCGAVPPLRRAIFDG